MVHHMTMFLWDVRRAMISGLTTTSRDWNDCVFLGIIPKWRPQRKNPGCSQLWIEQSGSWPAVYLCAPHLGDHHLPIEKCCNSWIFLGYPGIPFLDKAISYHKNFTKIMSWYIISWYIISGLIMVYLIISHHNHDNGISNIYIHIISWYIIWYIYK